MIFGDECKRFKVEMIALSISKLVDRFQSTIVLQKGIIVGDS